jgi:predicted permease
MSALRWWIRRLQNALFPGRGEREAMREIEAHLQLLEDDLLGRGMSAEEARTAARRALGGRDTIRRSHQDARSFIWLDDLRRDVAYTARSLVRAPAFAAVVILTLALGIGATTAIFTVVDHVLVRSLPLPHADRLVRLYESNTAEGSPREDASPANAADWRRAATAFDLMTVIGGTSLTMTGGAEPEAIIGMVVDPQFFTLTGATPELGHLFPPTAYHSAANAQLGPVRVREKPAGTADVILSHGLWLRQFGGDPNVVGRAITLNEQRAVVAGVMPAAFRFDESEWGTADCWIPLTTIGPAARRYRSFLAIARLKPDVSVEAAQSEMTSVAAGLARAYPADAGWTVRVEPLKDALVSSDARLTLLILLGGAGCLLLIAGANVTNLVLMRATGRVREVAVRMAIGAGRTRLIRQWMTESTVLALAGGVGGFLVSSWASPVLGTYAPLGLPHIDVVAADFRIFAFSMILALVVGLSCGLAPAFASLHTPLAALRSSAPLGGSRRQQWLRLSLVTAQVAVAIVLLVGGGLLGRTLLAVRSVDLGVAPSGVLTFGAFPRYEQVPSIQAFHRALLARIEAIPGVEAAGIGTLTPVTGVDVALGGGEKPLAVGVDAPSPGYFGGLGIRLRKGRLFDDHDRSNAPPVAVVNNALARRAWGTVDVVGRRLRLDMPDMPWLTVVGVVDDVRITSLEASSPPILYIPYDQNALVAATMFVVRTTGDPHQLLGPAKAAVKSLDPNVAVTRPETLDERLAKLVAAHVFNFWLLGAFSAIALLLAAIGVYGMVGEVVASRTPEFAVRMALGADRWRVLRPVLRRTMAVTMAGTAIGLSVMVVTVRWLGTLLFGVRPLDPLTLVLVPLVFLAAAVIATIGPVRRVTRIDPMIALKQD